MAVFASSVTPPLNPLYPISDDYPVTLGSLIFIVRSVHFNRFIVWLQ